MTSIRIDQYLLLNNIDFHQLPILIDHFCCYQFLFDKYSLNTFSLKYTVCTVTILTPVEKDSSVTMDSGAKLDAVGGGGTEHKLMFAQANLELLFNSEVCLLVLVLQ